MPVARVHTKSQWEAFARALDALPEKPEAEHGVAVRDAMKDMRSRVRAAQTKGYTLEQIAKQAKLHGIDITAGTIRYALPQPGRAAVPEMAHARAAGRPGGAAGTSARCSATHE